MPQANNSCAREKGCPRVCVCLMKTIQETMGKRFFFETKPFGKFLNLSKLHKSPFQHFRRNPHIIALKMRKLGQRLTIGSKRVLGYADQYRNRHDSKHKNKNDLQKLKTSRIFKNRGSFLLFCSILYFKLEIEFKISSRTHGK